MKIVPVLASENKDGSILFTPAEPLPDNAIAIICDGKNYFIFEIGDKLSEIEELLETKKDDKNTLSKIVDSIMSIFRKDLIE